MQEKAVSNTITNLLKWAVDQLSDITDTASLDAHIILETVIEKNKLYIILNKNELLDDVKVEKFKEYIKTRISGVPVQYIVNHQEFMGLDFYVDKNVLIPRSDTEPLVEELINIARNFKLSDGNLQIMDIGTGSGAITISLAHFIRNSNIVSVDISSDAIEVAKKNAEANNVDERISFINSDLFENIDVTRYKKSFDIIVSNPPYIPTADIDELQIEVASHEPRLALDGGLDGYDYYKRIITDAHVYLKNNGILAFEVGYNQGDEIKKMLLSANYDKIRFVKDLSGINRIVIGELTN